MEQSNNTALLIMDMQSGITGMLGDGAADPLALAAKAIAAARTRGIPVIYVVVGFRNGTPEISSNNATFGAFKERMAGVDMSAFMQVHPTVAPAAGEVIVTKRRVSAFTGSDLEVVLRAQGINHLILTGFSTSGVVLSTLREAADKDYSLTVLSDCCADHDAQVHNVLLQKVFARQATVITAEEWIK